MMLSVNDKGIVSLRDQWLRARQSRLIQNLLWAASTSRCHRDCFSLFRVPCAVPRAFTASLPFVLILIH